MLFRSETRVAPRTWVGAGVARRVIDYDPGYAFEGADLARQLNRTEDTATAAMRTALSPFTTLTAQVSVGWDMFDLQPERDTNNVRANIGFQLDWRELLEFPDVQRVVDRELDVCARVGRIIVPCPEAFDELVRCDARFQALRPRVQHVLTGGRRRSTTATHSPAEVRARFGLPLDQPVGLFLGNREPYRGLDRLLNGILALDEPRVIPGVIAVAGPDVDAVPRSARVRPLGRVDDVASLLTAVDFVVNTNRFSLFDLSLVEAVEAALDAGDRRVSGMIGGDHVWPT